MNKKILAIIIIFAFGGAIWDIVNADKREPVSIAIHASSAEMSIDDIIIKSDLILIGEFTKIHPSRWNTPTGRLPENASIESISEERLIIFTDSDFQVAQRLKGSDRRPVVCVRTFGGQVGKDQMTAPNEQVYEIQKVYLLFLFKNTGRTSGIGKETYYGIGPLYEIQNGKAISKTDEWNLDELIVYIQDKLSETNSMNTTTEGLIDEAFEIPEIATPQETIPEIEMPAP